MKLVLNNSEKHSFIISWSFKSTMSPKKLIMVQISYYFEQTSFNTAFENSLRNSSKLFFLICCIQFWILEILFFCYSWIYLGTSNFYGTGLWNSFTIAPVWTLYWFWYCLGWFDFFSSSINFCWDSWLLLFFLLGYPRLP
jgi:hypothetical protein